MSEATKVRRTERWWIDAKGYIEGEVKTAQGPRRVRQHRFVMECHLGRRLSRHEDVHHIDGNKQNNAIENLQVLPHGEHTTITNSGRTYKRGHSINITEEDRFRRAERMRAAQPLGTKAAANARAAIAKALGS